jgi:hypothetical protein
MRDRYWANASVALASLLALTGCCSSAGIGDNYEHVGPAEGAPPPNPPPPSSAPPPPPPGPLVCETRDVYTLCVRQDYTRVPAETIAHMKERFFDVYPRLADRFNRGTVLTVNFVIGESNNIAEAAGDTVTYRGQWMNDHGNDYDVVVHEIMHIIEAYDFGRAPSWLTEGIADYARYHYGVNNQAAGWHLQMPVQGGLTYTAGYGTAARFLIWAEERYDVELVEAPHSKRMRAGAGSSRSTRDRIRFQGLGIVPPHRRDGITLCQGARTCANPVLR